MPDIKISQFSTAPTFNATDLVTGLQGGTNVNWAGSTIDAFILRPGGSLATQMAAKAPLDSPVFLNNPQAPTQPTATNNTLLATTAFVHAVMAAGGGGSFILNQNASAQVGNFWIQGTGKISSNGVPSMEWHQTAGAGYGVFIPFSTSTIPLGYFSLGDSGRAEAFINVSVPSTGKSVAIWEGVFEVEGYSNEPFARFSGVRMNDLFLLKNYNNNLHTPIIGANTVALWDITEDAYRLLIKQNGNMIVGGGTTDNGARLQVTGGPLSLNPATADPTVIDGSMFYRSDTGRFRGAVAGAWKNFLMEGDSTGTGSFIENQFASPQLADYWISGAAIIGGGLSVNKALGYGIEVTSDSSGQNPAAGKGFAFGWNKSGINGESNLVWCSDTGSNRMLEIGHWNGTTYVANVFIGPTGGVSLTGILALASQGADPAGVNGATMYRNDTHKFRAFVNGAWQNILTDADGAPLAKFKFIPSSPYTVLPEDDGQILVWGTVGTPCTVNVATGLRNGWQCEIWQDSTGVITFADAGGAQVHSRGELKNTAGQYAGVTLCHLTGGQFRLAGDLA